MPERQLGKVFMRPLTVLTTVVILLLAGTALAQRYAVSASIANIRSGPGTQYDILWQVEQYYPVMVVERKDSWFRFKDFEGDEGWIHGNLIRKIPAVITAAERCNLRSGPGTKYEIVDTAERGVPFKVLKARGSWLHVLHARKGESWIHKSLVW
jgi:SH3-like domain-containing protein